MKRLIQKILISIKNFIKSGLDELYQIQHEELFIRQRKDKK